MQRRLTVAAFVVGGTIAVIAVVAALRNSPELELPGPDWTGPVRMQRGGMVVEHMGDTWQEPRDVVPDFVDVTQIDLLTEIQPHWTLHLAAKPPRAVDLGPGLLIAYGLIFETTGDGNADYEVGINNGAPTPGDFRVWVTTLATGETEEQVGPPYGFPIEFRHPDEHQANDPPEVATRMAFTFLPGSVPAGLNPATSSFYAWIVMTDRGDAVAWDYAPNDRWLTLAAVAAP